MESVKHQLKDEESKQQAVYEKEKKQAQDKISELNKEVHDLNATEAKLQKEIAKEQKQIKQEQVRASDAEAKIATEHKAFLQAKKVITGQKAQLADDKKKMQQ